MIDDRQRALVIAAQPDNAEFTSGGTIARLVRERWKVRCVICTNGDKGSADPSVSPHDLATTCGREQRAAAAVLGIAEVLFLGHPDGALANTPALIVELVRIIRELHPDRMLTWDPWRRYQLHADHCAAGSAELDGVLAAGNPHYFPDQFDPARVHRVEGVYLFGSDQPDASVDIGETTAQKMEALQEHRSQVANIQIVAERMSQCNRGAGAWSGYTYAEAFKVLHPFCDA